MKTGIYLGIDTSNYTTSVAILDRDGKIIANIKRPLEVRDGERGLRQSDAVFHHVRNLPSAMREAGEYIRGGGPIIAIGVSKRPRNIDGSYMPCFLAGVSAAESIAASSGAPIFEFSHQCGHIMAALLSSGADFGGNIFPAFHVSGGTTELLSVKESGSGFSADIVGGSSDITAGQAIDRIGVYMGLRFPAGAELERLALRYDGKIPSRAPSLKGMYASFSGLENLATALYDQTGDKPQVAAFVFDYIGKSLIKMSEEYIKINGETPLLYAGGVMSSTILKRMLSSHFRAYFAEPSLSSDNAVGIAELARREYEKTRNG